MAAAQPGFQRDALSSGPLSKATPRGQVQRATKDEINPETGLVKRRSEILKDPL